ncbi:MAG: hypothetical protein JXB20_05325 [Bacilli bacterium]|nr:hypothetical protein [Bacilli bacterium]MBN2696500.1 hypothetical protein [Bacilli bacterium]
MKWTIYELKKHHRTNNSFTYVMDPTVFLKNTDDDLVDAGPVEVKGNFHYVEAEERFVFQVNVICKLKMLCAITLKPVRVDLDFSTQLDFSTKIDDDYTNPIDGVTIDLDAYIWAEILIEKPMKVVSPHAYDNYIEEKTSLTETEIMEDNPFAKLKKQ